MRFKPNEKLWVEKYRPDRIDDCILKPQTKKELKAIVESGHIPNMLLYGHQGSGKTTVAKALCQEMGLDWIVVNASNERGLDVIRDRIMSFASTTSLTGNGKCFILDEADHLLPNTQAALRNASEELSKGCSFIMTANYPNRIIEPLHSRFNGVSFNVDGKDMEKMQAQFFVRLTQMLDNEKVEYDERVLITVIQKYFPDNRRIIGKLQQYATGSGKIDTGILMSMEELSIDNLIESIKNKKFKDISQWAADNAANDTSGVYEQIYKALKPKLEKNSIPDAIMILEEAQRYDGVVPSKELHLVAAAVELMMGVEFR